MLRAKIGTVVGNADISKTGKFDVVFKLSTLGKPTSESVQYVSPMGTNKQAFIAIPPRGSQALCIYDDEVSKEGATLQGYYYVGSLMGVIPGLNNAVPVDDNPPEESPPGPYLSKDKPGIEGPKIPSGKAPMVLAKNLSPWPGPFQ